MVRYTRVAPGSSVILATALLGLGACSSERVQVSLAGAYFERGHPVVPVCLRAITDGVVLRGIRVSTGDPVDVPLPLTISKAGQAEYHVKLRRSNREWRQQWMLLEFEDGHTIKAGFQDVQFRTYQ
jgi:hypothetical protein